MLALRNRPTAAVCYNDVVAFGALSELGERGLMAGRDFSVIGFDGVAATAHSNPPLTTIDVDPGRLGKLPRKFCSGALREPDSPPVRYLGAAAVDRAAIVAKAKSQGKLAKNSEEEKREETESDGLISAGPLLPCAAGEGWGRGRLTVCVRQHTRRSP